MSERSANGSFGLRATSLFWFFFAQWEKRTVNKMLPASITSATPRVIFSLLGIPDEETNQEIYYKLIEQGTDLEQYDSNKKIEELAEGIFKQLMG